MRRMPTASARAAVADESHRAPAGDGADQKPGGREHPPHGVDAAQHAVVGFRLPKHCHGKVKNRIAAITQQLPAQDEQHDQSQRAPGQRQEPGPRHRSGGRQQQCAPHAQACDEGLGGASGPERRQTCHSIHEAWTAGEQQHAAHVKDIQGGRHTKVQALHRGGCRQA